MFIASVILFVIISPLVAAELQATYEEESNPTIQNNSAFGLVYNRNKYDVAFRIGTLSIISVGSGDPPELEELELNRNGFGHKDKSKLLTTEKINGKDEFKAVLVARISYCNGSKTRVMTIEDDDDELLDEDDVESCTNPYPITIEFFMVIKHIPDAALAEGIGFQFKQNNGPGNFQIEFEGESGGSSVDLFFPINDETSFPPFLPPDYTDGSGSSFINIEEIDTTWDASLSIDQTTTGTVFDVVTQLGTSSGAKVGVAKLVLYGYQGHPEYSVHITFEDDYKGIGDNSFNLKHTQLNVYIPFTLFLAGEEVTNGQSLIWSGLGFAPQLNHIDLYVKVNSYIAASKVAGEYSDTITATISPIETL